MDLDDDPTFFCSDGKRKEGKKSSEGSEEGNCILGNGDVLLAADGLQNSEESLDRIHIVETKVESMRIMKNICLISVAFMLIFNYSGLFSLQSSLHRVKGMGVITSSINMASVMLSCMFLPKIIIKLIGHKWTIVIALWSYILYIAANGYAVWGTMITVNILMGLWAAPMWTAQCSYFTIIGRRYAKLNKEKEDVVVARFFGIFFMILRMCMFLFNYPSSYEPSCTSIMLNETVAFTQVRA